MGVTQEMKSTGGLIKVLSFAGTFVAVVGAMLTYFFASQGSQDAATAVVRGQVDVNCAQIANLQEQSKATVLTLESVRNSVQSMSADVREIQAQQTANARFLDERFSDLKRQLDRLESK